MSNAEPRSGSRVEPVPSEPSMSRYDLVLAVIPLAFVAALFGGRLIDAPTHLAVASGSAVGALAVADALFVNPPR